MPISIPPVDGEVNLVIVELGAECGEKLADLGVDGAGAAEVVVMLSDLKEAFTWDIASAENVFEEGDDILLFFGSSKGDYKYCVVLRHASAELVIIRVESLSNPLFPGRDDFPMSRIGSGIRSRA